MSEVADRVGLEPSAFSRAFRRLTGMNFSDYSRSLRVWRARTLLSENEMPITDICFEAGFNNLSISIAISGWKLASLPEPIAKRHASERNRSSRAFRKNRRMPPKDGRGHHCRPHAMNSRSPERLAALLPCPQPLHAGSLTLRE
nr:helix-turn-helix transcriptional regulator [Rhizobium rhizolycopersici]